MSEEFFVGYLPMPPATGRRMRKAAIGLVVLAIVTAIALAIATGPFDRATFEYATETAWQGTIEAAPAPVLIAIQRDTGSAFATTVRYPLVAPGKHGAGGLIAPFAGAPVTLRGKRIQRGATTMLELVPGSIERYAPALPADGTPIPASNVEALGHAIFTGEVVDSKCYLGVMNPGRLEVHRACAKRCVAGGIPPMLAAHGDNGKEAHLLLVKADGSPFGDAILPLVGETVTLEGRLERRDGLYYLYVE